MDTRSGAEPVARTAYGWRRVTGGPPGAASAITGDTRVTIPPVAAADPRLLATRSLPRRFNAP